MFRGVPPVSAAAHFACLPIAHDSVGRRQVRRWPIAPAGLSPRPYTPPANQYQAFRNRQNGGYWGGGAERIEITKTRKKVHLRGDLPPVGGPWGSQVSAAAHFVCLPIAHGSAECRKIPPRPIVPTGVSPRPIIRPTTNNRRFETTEPLGIGEGRMKGDKDRIDSEKAAKNRRI